MSKIIRRKSDNKVFYCLDNAETTELTSTQFNFTLGGGARAMIAQDINSNTHDLLTGITAPTRFSGSGIFSYTDDGWSINSDVLAAINGSMDAMGQSNITVEL